MSDYTKLTLTNVKQININNLKNKLNCGRVDDFLIDTRNGDFIFVFREIDLCVYSCTYAYVIIVTDDQCNFKHKIISYDGVVIGTIRQYNSELFVSVISNNTIKIFDIDTFQNKPKYEFLTDIIPYTIVIKDDKIYISDMNEISIYSPTGNHMGGYNIINNNYRAYIHSKSYINLNSQNYMYVMNSCTDISIYDNIRLLTTISTGCASAFIIDSYDRMITIYRHIIKFYDVDGKYLHVLDFESTKRFDEIKFTNEGNLAILDTYNEQLFIISIV